MSESSQGEAAASAPRSAPIPWRCGKCGHDASELGQARQSGSALASLFDVEGLRFTTVSCKRCGFTEFYKGDASMLLAVFDFGIT